MSRPRVPAAPFLAWCERQLRVIANHGGVGDFPLDHHHQRRGGARASGRGEHAILAWRLGIEAHTLWWYLNGNAGTESRTLLRCSVEDMLHRAGEDFDTVYPEYQYERDVALEPEVWCARCQEITTPLEGRCLWCEQRVADADGVAVHVQPPAPPDATLAWQDAELAWQEAPPPSHPPADHSGAQSDQEWSRDDLAA